VNEIIRLLFKVVSWSVPGRTERNQENSVIMADIMTKVAAGHIQTTTMHEVFVLP